MKTINKKIDRHFFYKTTVFTRFSFYSELYNNFVLMMFDIFYNENVFIVKDRLKLNIPNGFTTGIFERINHRFTSKYYKEILNLDFSYHSYTQTDSVWRLTNEKNRPLRLG